MKNTGEINFLQNVGNRLYQLRNEKELSRRELSDKSGISEQHIAKIENGKSGLTVEALMKLSHVLDISLADFFREGFR